MFVGRCTREFSGRKLHLLRKKPEVKLEGPTQYPFSPGYTV